MTKTIQLLKTLTEAHGIPGYEAPARAVVRETLDGLGELNQDKFGSVISKLDADQAAALTA